MFNLRADWSPADAWTVWTALNYHGKEVNAAARVGTAGTTISSSGVKEYKAYTLADLGVTHAVNQRTSVSAAIYNLTDKRLDEQSFNTVGDGRRLWVSLTQRLMEPLLPGRRRILGAAMLACLPAWAEAQPDLSHPLGPTIADTGSAWYRFSRFTLGSVDGQRSYRITVGVPLRPPPPQGYPAIVLLDGNAALAAIDEPQLQALQDGSPPVIVAVGYDTALRFDGCPRV
jgi:hypothetical protein